MSVGIDIKIPKLPSFRAAMKKAPALVLRNIKDALHQSVAEIQRATVPLTPHKTGELERSILRGATVQALSARVSPDKEYALAQHEHTEYRHPIKGQAKYLEQGAREATPKIVEHLNAALKRAIDSTAASV